MVGRLSEAFGLTETQAQLVVTAAAIVLLFLVRAVVVAVVHRRIDDAAVWYRTRKALSYTTTVIGIVVVATIWFDGSGVVTYLGFLTAALAIALGDVVKNFAGWLYIVLRRPFRLGDRIELAGHTGDVVDIRVFRFAMLEVGGRVRQVTGSMLHMPNGMVFTEPLTNYSEGFAYIWHEIPVLVTFESDWEAAEALVLEAVKEASAAISPDQVAQQLRQTATEYRFHITDLAPSTDRDRRRFGHPRHRPSAGGGAWGSTRRRAESVAVFAQSTRRERRHRPRLSDGSHVFRRSGRGAAVGGVLALVSPRG